MRIEISPANKTPVFPAIRITKVFCFFLILLQDWGGQMSRDEKSALIPRCFFSLLLLFSRETDVRREKKG